MMHGVIDTATAQERRAMVDRVLQARQRAVDLVHSAAEALLPALDAAQRTDRRGPAARRCRFGDAMWAAWVNPQMP